ncbi:hypothetical protein GA830_14780 [Mesorhizobium sp. NBSH29]|uniref:hypothetical protein n=1 Tax=Mesorhizobium sp. NBSH29 TaxID=2654249 RepID=UPI0018964558|nr:hypothetical protein [Mesorhizobium sp. NBSH29]QPC87871.1 hypothetical protein GA830_14780 [Mesorhizobium sp. NBSH29]
MKNAVALAANDFRTVDSKILIRIFYGIAALAVLSLIISFGGRWFGHAIALAGHTEDSTPYEVVIGNNVLKVPGNKIRFDRSRRDGIADRLELYLHWPDMGGYSTAHSDDFNNLGPDKRLLFVSLEPQIMSRDMSGRFEPIYSALIAKPGKPASAGITLYDFTEKSGYSNELLAVAARPGDNTPFVARCLSGPTADESLAACERDITVGDGLILSYRFSRELLDQWSALDAAIIDSARSMLQTGR